MSEFARLLDAANAGQVRPGCDGGPQAVAYSQRNWGFVAYDQLNAGLGPLATHPPQQVGIVIVECPAKASRRPYHKQKLALLLANLRHFALEQAARGVAVWHMVAPSYAAAAQCAQRRVGPMWCMTPAEYEMRVELAPLFANGTLREVPHTGWLTTAAQFAAWVGGSGPWRMDGFYRAARQASGYLMNAGKPVGGRYSFDGANREPWHGQPPAPTPPGATADLITDEVVALVQERFAAHPGAIVRATLLASSSDIARHWQWCQTHALPHFGPYEDAMSRSAPTLFHTQLAPLLNLHRLLPRAVVEAALALDIPLASKEGFVRQILGWREFVHHVHVATAGFRSLHHIVSTPLDASTRRAYRGDAGWWAMAAAASAAPRYPVSGAPSQLAPVPRRAEGQTAAHPSPRDARAPGVAKRRAETEPHVTVPSVARGTGRETGASERTGAEAPEPAWPNLLQSHQPLPAAFWGKPSGLACVDHVVQDVLATGYSHHITRLMVLGNVASLLDVEPRHLTDWFWAAYVDAYDWVVEPNVLAMATFAVGDVMTTKPYIAGSGYLHKMSDYCGACVFHPKASCPLTAMYWAYLERHQAVLAGNPRMLVPLAALRKRTPVQKARDAEIAATVQATLARGAPVRPVDVGAEKPAAKAGRSTSTRAARAPAAQTAFKISGD